jgi:predicted PurR-regulated permease PerM
MTDSQRWLLFGLLLLTGFLIYVLQPILMPFLVAAFFAYLGDPVVDRLEEGGISRLWSVCIVFLIAVILVFLLMLVLVPLLGRQVDTLVETFPVVIVWLQEQALPKLQQYFDLPEINQMAEKLKTALLKNWQSAGGVVEGLVSKVSHSGLIFAGWIANMLLIPVVAFYLLRDWDVLMAKIEAILPRRWQATTVKLAGECDEVLSAFLRGQLMIMVLLGIIYAIGLWIVGLKLALLVGLIAGLASVVPYLGFVVGIVSASIAALVQFHDWLPLVYVAVVFGIGQMLEGMVLTPLLVGDKIGLHPVAVIFAVLAGGQLFGFVGVLLALPVAAVIMVILRHVHDSYLSSVFYGEEPGLDNEPADQDSAEFELTGPGAE